MDEYEMYYFDDVDTRNATRDHRPTGSRPVSVVRPRRPVVSSPSRPMAVYSPSSVAPYSPPFVPPQYTPAQMMYGSYQTFPTEGITAASLLNRWTLPQLLEIGAAAFAALQSLPQAPNNTESVETNVANMIQYQKLLAEHAKRDEQIRTLGALVARLAA